MVYVLWDLSNFFILIRGIFADVNYIIIIILSGTYFNWNGYLYVQHRQWNQAIYSNN